MNLVSRAIRAILVQAIRLYQVAVSPWLGNHCRFYPSCSVYARQALETHGCCRGIWLAARRLLKCHPFHPGGVDRVPGALPEP